MVYVAELQSFISRITPFHVHNELHAGLKGVPAWADEPSAGDKPYATA